ETIEKENYEYIQPRIRYTVPLTEEDFRAFVEQFDNPSDDEVTEEVKKLIDIRDSWSVRIYDEGGGTKASFTLYFSPDFEAGFGISGELDETAKVAVEMSENAAREMYNDFAKEQEIPVQMEGIRGGFVRALKNIKYLFKREITISPVTAILRLDEFMEGFN
ncbi:MAG: hypothetical protein ABIF92_02495, partial [archaeon]